MQEDAEFIGTVGSASDSCSSGTAMGLDPNGAKPPSMIITSKTAKKRPEEEV